MATYDRKFEILTPLDKLNTRDLEVAQAGLLDPNSTSPLALIDGELLELTSTGKAFQRSTSTELPAWFCFAWRGATEHQVSRKTVVIWHGSFEADTLVFDGTSVVVGSPLMSGNVTLGGTRRGLILRTSTNTVIGYALRLAANNGGRLRFMQTLV